MRRSDRHAQRFFPGAGFLLAVLADQRCGEALVMVYEVPPKPALDAQKLSIETGVVAVIGANDFDCCEPPAWSCTHQPQWLQMVPV